MSALEGNTGVLAATPDEDLGPGTYWRGILRGPSQLAWDWTFLSQHEQVPEIPVITREEPQVSHRNSRKSEILSSMRDEAFFHCGILREIPLSLFSL